MKMTNPRVQERDARPRHPWIDPDEDGHNCSLCSSDSIWKCDKQAHPTDPWAWLSDEDRKSLRDTLDAMYRARMAALDAAVAMPLSSIDSLHPQPADSPPGNLADDPVAFRLGFVDEQSWKAAHDHDEKTFTWGCLGCARHHLRIAEYGAETADSPVCPMCGASDCDYAEPPEAT